MSLPAWPSVRSDIHAGAAGRPARKPLWQKLCETIEAERLTDIGFTPPAVSVSAPPVPLMVVYPDGIWYRPTTPEDIDKIVESHLKLGRRVDRLVMVLTRN